MCLTLDAVKRGYELLDHKNVDRDIYGDDLADARAERDQLKHDRDATAGELAMVQHDVEDIAVELSEAITGLERAWRWRQISQYNIDQLGVIVTRLRVHAPATTEGE